MRDLQGEDEVEMRRRCEAPTHGKEKPTKQIATNKLLSEGETADLTDEVKRSDPFGYFEYRDFTEDGI